MTRAIWIGFGVVALLLAPASQAQTATSAPVRIASAFPTGSGPDVVTRLVADKLADVCEVEIEGVALLSDPVVDGD